MAHRPLRPGGADTAVKDTGALDPAFAFVDAHHHLWDLARIDYPWLKARGVRRFFGDPTPIQRNYLPEDLRRDSDGIFLEASVHIQVGAAPGEEVRESAWLAETAARTGLPSAFVAFCDLAAENREAVLDAHQTCSGLRGVRQIIGRHPAEDAKLGTEALLVDRRFRAGLESLHARGLSFDLQVTSAMLERAARVFANVPALPVALCHIGSPWDRTARGLAMWRDGLRRFADLPRSFCKLSGFGMFEPGWTRESIAPLVETVLDTFGADRTMWGSNFPVEKLARLYRPALEAVWSLVPAESRPAVFAGTAKRFYRLGARTV